MSVAVTEERVLATFDWLKWLADRGASSPTNKQIGLGPLKLGGQARQPADRVTGIKWPKAEHGAVVVAELERRGLITVERGSNWREITIIETGQVLGRRPPCFDGSSWQRRAPTEAFA